MNDTAPTNLADGLAKEIKRNQQLLVEYGKLENMPGVFVGFAVAMIRQELDFAIDAVSNQDLARMMQAYEDLKDNE